METSAIKADILSAVSGELDTWLAEQSKIKDGLEFEARFMEFSRKLSHVILLKTLGKQPGSRNKKKLHTLFGKVHLSKKHPLCQHTQRFGISGKLQEVICLLAQGQVFEEAEEILKELLGLDISAKQIQRVSEHYGQALEGLEQSYAKGDEKPPALKLKNPEEPVYIMFDGSMLFMRKEKWKEVKVGRVFTESACVAIQDGRREILQSQYVCHLGGHTEFLEKWEAHTESYRNKICIADGAKWIWNWADDYHPGMVQILDFFHAVQKIGDYAALQYDDKVERGQWMETQKKRLKDNQVGKVIEELASHSPKNGDAEKAQTDAIRYYENNRDRMQYKTYLEKGYLIGSACACWRACAGRARIVG